MILCLTNLLAFYRCCLLVEFDQSPQHIVPLIGAKLQQKDFVVEN